MLLPDLCLAPSPRSGCHRSRAGHGITATIGGVAASGRAHQVLLDPRVAIHASVLLLLIIPAAALQVQAPKHLTQQRVHLRLLRSALAASTPESSSILPS